jgi:hypothetical protein
LHGRQASQRRLRPGLFGFWQVATPEARRALVAAAMGWGLDAFDVMLYALVLAALMRDLGMAKSTAGLLGSLTLVASALGGVLFGLVADRHGRTRALIGSILIYSVFTGACRLAQTILQLAVFRVLLGLGMGGEWASGATLVSETWPAEHRGKALGLVQSSWAVGYGAAALVTWIVMPVWGWRAVFFVGVVPALFTAWILRRVEEPAIWRERRRSASASERRFGDIFRGSMLPLTVAVTLMNACTMFAWWGFNLWLPATCRSRPTAASGSASGDVGDGLRDADRMWFGCDVQVHQRRHRPPAVMRDLPRDRRRPDLRVHRDRQPVGAARPRARRGVLRDRLLQRLRRRDRGDLSNRHPRDRAGLHLQHRAPRQRRRPVRRRALGRDAGFRVGAVPVGRGFLLAALTWSLVPERGPSAVG